MGKIPPSHVGRLRRCDICGFWYGEREGKLFKQRGLYVDKQCFDSLTNEQRENQVRRRIR